MDTADPAPSPVRSLKPARTPWRLAVPVVCLLGGLLLATTHAVSRGGEIRGSDAPRLVDLVRDAQRSVDRLSGQRDDLITRIDNNHLGSPGVDAALGAITSHSLELAADAGLDAVHGPGLVVTLDDAHRDADGRFPRDASPDDLVVHQQDIQAVLNALWGAGAEAVALQDQRITGLSAPRCVGNTLLLNGRTYSPPYVVTAIGNVAAMRAGLATAPLVILYKQYVVRFGLGYDEQPGEDVSVVGHTAPIRLRYAAPAGPVG